jgi:hypothetical protein
MQGMEYMNESLDHVQSTGTPMPAPIEQLDELLVSTNIASTLPKH